MNKLLITFIFLGPLLSGDLMSADTTNCSGCFFGRAYLGYGARIHNTSKLNTYLETIGMPKLNNYISGFAFGLGLGDYRYQIDAEVIFYEIIEKNMSSNIVDMSSASFYINYYYNIFYTNSFEISPFVSIGRSGTSVILNELEYSDEYYQFRLGVQYTLFFKKDVHKGYGKYLSLKGTINYPSILNFTIDKDNDIYDLPNLLELFGIYLYFGGGNWGP